MKHRCIIIILFLFTHSVLAQEYSRKDSLRGHLTNLRSCYNVTFYDLNIVIDDSLKYIGRSSNTIYFEALTDFNKFQLDLFNNLNIISIEFEQRKLNFKREYDAIFIFFDREIKRSEKLKIKIIYQGYPKEAKNPPWDGGFSWNKDKNNNPWIGISCQGLGASSWWPCKDHQSDEPDSMRIVASVRSPLKVVSNGNLRGETLVWNSSLKCFMNTYEWFVSYPINSYNVTLNIGDYDHFSDTYISKKDTLKLDYYVLCGNLDKAKLHFTQVKPMMECFENFFGPYPFWDDGYALVETPYLGMEHQSAISYGNNFLQGYNGDVAFIDSLYFDYIIVHESGHEWWGNSITTNDIADMWVHEGFCTYAEVLYVECMYGYNAMLSYAKNQKKYIKNDKPVLGHYHVNKCGSSDMYFKGSLMLHTLRTLIDDDKIWFEIIFEISKNFKYHNVNSDDIINFINSKTEQDFSVFFEQYLKNKNLPIFEYSLQKEGPNTTLIFRWNAINNFKMPILINTGKEDFWIYPNNEFSEIDLGNFDRNLFNIRKDLFLMEVKKW